MFFDYLATVVALKVVDPANFKVTSNVVFHKRKKTHSFSALIDTILEFKISMFTAPRLI